MKASIVIFRKLSPLLQKLYGLYSSFDHRYTFRNLKIYVKKGVFNPILFHSTIDLINYVESTKYQKGRMLELGCGSSLASLYFAKKDWEVTASDISKNALMNASLNATINKIELRIVESDLFEKFANQSFDLVLINPPYFPKNAKNEDEKAWYCGASFQYYHQLFKAVRNRFEMEEKYLMVLSDQCEIEKIKSIAKENQIEMSELSRKSHFYEDILIFSLTKILS